MKKKIVSAILATTLIVNTAQANDDAAWAIGGFILGVIVGNNDRDDHRDPPPPPPPPPRREPRLVPIYKTVCESWVEYDYWGNPRSIRKCHQEIVAYREVY